jgi:hypothetical protein
VLLLVVFLVAFPHLSRKICGPKPLNLQISNILEVENIVRKEN